MNKPGQDIWISCESSNLRHGLMYRASNSVLLRCLMDASMQFIKMPKIAQSTQCMVSLELHPHNIQQVFAGTQQGNHYGFGGGCYEFGSWKMKFLNIPLIFTEFVLLGRCLPATYCTIYYGFKRMKEQQGLLIQQKTNHGCSRD